jgi:restriction endonuclease
MTAHSLIFLGKRFEDLLARFFRAEGFVVDVEAPVDPSGSHVDLIVTSPTKKRAVVEIKLYKSEGVARGVLMTAARQTESYRSAAGVDRGILAVTCRIDASTLEELKIFPNLTIYDYDVLKFLFAKHSDLSAEFESITDEAYTDRTGTRSAPIRQSIPQLEGLFDGPAPSPSDIEPEKKGRLFRDELRKIPTGRTDAAAFEKICQKCLEYAFADYLTDWRNQENTTTGLHRFDAGARIKPKNDFWIALNLNPARSPGAGVT